MQSPLSQHLADDRTHRALERADAARLARRPRSIGAPRRAIGLALIRLGLRIAGSAATRPAARAGG